MKIKRILAGILGLCMAGAALLPAHAQEVQYDVNADGAFDILDIIALIKYLHMDGKLQNTAAADVNADSEVDIFDLALMMRALVGLPVQPEDPQTPYVTTQSLSAALAPNPVETVDIDEATLLGQTAFALDLLRETIKADEAQGENVLVSPYSVSQALGMTANGAAGETLAGMESVLGGKIDTLNPAFYTLAQPEVWNLPKDSDFKPPVLQTANSIWFQTGYPVSQDFLQTNADYYSADAFSTPMDESTQREVNAWVDEHTDHMIDIILDDPPAGARILLVNAVAFDAQWVQPFEEYTINEADFTAADGTVQTVQMMHGGAEGAVYIFDDHADGFLLYYQGGRYAFAALLPEEGLTPEDYLETLDAKRLRETLRQNGSNVGLHLGLPEFSYDCDTSLVKPLAAMGMASAFGAGADFSRMTDEPNELYIDDVLHKTFIDVTPAGTRAAAVTAVITKDGVSMVDEYRDVILDRPFVYMIVDMQYALPIFIGTVNSVK